MASVVDICNTALTMTKANRIMSLSDDMEEARQCNALYTIARDSVLRSHPWNFAITRADLARLSAAPAWGWAYQFQLPVDCLRVLSLEHDYDYAIEGRVLLCDSDAVSISYVKREDDSEKYDALFVECLSVKLASMLAYPLSGSLTASQAFETVYQNKLAEARSVDAREGTPESVVSTGWLYAKLGNRRLD